MSVYTTKTIKREDAIEQIIGGRITPFVMSNDELAQEMFELFGDERLLNSRLENYIVED